MLRPRSGNRCIRMHHAWGRSGRVAWQEAFGDVGRVVGAAPDWCPIPLARRARPPRAGSRREDRRPVGPRKPIRRCICAGSWCTPRRTPPARPKPAPANSPPPGTSTGWPAPPGPGFTPPRTPLPPASRRSPQSAVRGPTCAPRSPTTPTANPCCRGIRPGRDRRRGPRPSRSGQAITGHSGGCEGGLPA